MFERKIIEEIKSIWDNHRAGGDMAEVPTLDIDDLQAIVETSFSASLKREENLPIDFSIVLFTQDDVYRLPAGQPYETMLKIVKFAQTLDFNEESISKLANAFDKNTTSLMVEPNNIEFGKYKIWGAMYYTPPRNFFDEASGFYRPNYLRVTVSSPGSLRLSRGYFVIGYFTLGKVVATTHSPFEKGAMGKYIQPLLNKNNGITWNGDINLEALKFLLFEAARRGHGSTIIIVPESQQEIINKITSDGYAFTGSLDISSLLEQLVSYLNKGLVASVERTKKIIVHRINALAQLAAVDGALLLTPNWDVISFGTKITAEKWNGNVLVGPEAFSRKDAFEEINFTKLGNRHNSTINFIGKCKGAVAFVISEDGPIRGLVFRDPEAILFWKDCRVSPFDEFQN